LGQGIARAQQDEYSQNKTKFVHTTSEDNRRLSDGPPLEFHACDPRFVGEL
jgi:hypothetical protein